MKRENFYRRNPSDALSGMVGLTLEERGVYNTIVDLLYLTWRPLEDSRAYIANHCGCAVQKLNPIIERLIGKGKLIRFEEGGISYLSNRRFEDERSEVKGAPKTRSGRGEVGEKSAGVGEKSAGVEENPPSCSEKFEEKPDVTALDKTRVDKTRNMSASASDVREAVEAIWSLTSPASRKRSSRKDVENAVKAFFNRSGVLDELLAALAVYFASDQAKKDGGRYAKGVHRLIEGDRWRDIAESLVLDGISEAVRKWDRDTWATALRRLAADPTQWTPRMGPRPGEPGCIVPPDLLIKPVAA